MRLLLHWLANALALLALPYIFTTITVDSFVTALIVAAVLALINTLIRPLLILLTLPVTILTLGLFIFIINGLCSGPSDRSCPDFTSPASGPACSARSCTA
jgi:putative membrane protein